MERPLGCLIYEAILIGYLVQTQRIIDDRSVQNYTAFILDWPKSSYTIFLILSITALQNVNYDLDAVIYYIFMHININYIRI